MKNRNIQFKPTVGVLIWLLLACFAAVFTVFVSPFALGQRATTKQSAVADLLLLGLAPVAALSNNDEPASACWTATDSLNTARYFHTATLLPKGKVLVAGGWDGFNPFTSAELYDPPSRMWSKTVSLNTARTLHTATLLPNGMVLVAGGRDSSGQPSVSAELYDPELQTWTATSSLNTAREEHTASLLPNGLVLVAGGLGTSGEHSASAELYEPAHVT